MFIVDMIWVQNVSTHVTLSELFYRLFRHNSSVLEVTYYAHNNASIMWKSLLASCATASERSRSSSAFKKTEASPAIIITIIIYYYTSIIICI